MLDEFGLLLVVNGRQHGDSPFGPEVKERVSLAVVERIEVGQGLPNVGARHSADETVRRREFVID